MDKGQVIPDGLLSEEEIATSLAEGRIVLVPESSEGVEGGGDGGEGIPIAGTWNLDPATLADLTMEDLLVKVIEIDATVNVEQFETEAEVIAFLSADFDVTFEEEVPVIEPAIDPDLPGQAAGN